MSHYTTYVITKTDSRNELDRLMLPYHEYECTGITDYCEYVDKTADAIENYAKNKDDYESIGDFLESWYGVSQENIFEDEPEEKPEDEYAIVKDGRIIKMYDFTNPNHKWDYYVPYSWKPSAYVKLDDEVADDVMAIKKSQFDIDAFMNAKKDYFTGLYNKLKPYFTEDFISWEKAKEDNKDNIGKAREVYNSQKSIKDMDNGIGSGEMFNIRWSIDVDSIAALTEEEFVKKNLDEAAPFWAIVTPEGEWIEHGHMGWWAVTWDEDTNFNKTWTELWKSITDDHYVWVCDCHT